MQLLTGSVPKYLALRTNAEKVTCVVIVYAPEYALRNDTEHGPSDKSNLLWVVEDRSDAKAAVEACIARQGGTWVKIADSGAEQLLVEPSGMIKVRIDGALTSLTRSFRAGGIAFRIMAETLSGSGKGSTILAVIASGDEEVSIDFCP